MDKNQLKAILRSAWSLDEEIQSYKERIVVGRARAEKNTPHYGPQTGGGASGKGRRIRGISWSTVKSIG